ncbi:hypothetical protein EMCRGX_G017810 [Ephydatia muelleri]
MLALTSLPPALRMNVSNLILAGIWLGPVKPKMEMILQPVLEKLDVYGKEIDKQDKIMLRIKPPHSFQYLPQSLMVSSTFWKASEHRAWLLYYALPILMHILPPDYAMHLSLLITSLHILLGTSISKEDISKCRELLTATTTRVISRDLVYC